MFALPLPFTLLFRVVLAGQPRGIRTGLLRLLQLPLPRSCVVSRLRQYLCHFALVDGRCLVVLIVDVPHEVLVVVLQFIYEFQEALYLPLKRFRIVAQLMDHSLEVGVLGNLL